jgi:hypothetical protein
MKNKRVRAVACVGTAAGALLNMAVVQADVTVQQNTSLNVVSMIQMHGSTTTTFTADKKREDTESHCEGMMSLVCGNVRGGEIVRLDRGLTWHLEPSKKTYREDIFATPEETAEMRARMQARLEKMRSCPVSQKQQPVDQSKCHMSPPKIDVHKTGDKASIAGYEAQRTNATLTTTCTDKDTGDVCDTVISVDLWLTQDKLPGAGDRAAFGQAYAKKLGLIDEQGALSGESAKYLAPYMAQIKELTDKSGDLKGQRLKTSLRVLMGGQQCSAINKAQADGSASGGTPAAGSANPMDKVAQAGKALGSSVGNLMGGLFKKKTDSQPAASAATPADTTAASAASPGNNAAPGAAMPGDNSAVGAAMPGDGAAARAGSPTAGAAVSNSPDPYAKYLQMATYTIETTAISTDTVPADRFEVPADWKKQVPTPVKQGGDDDFTCPKTAG